MERLRELKRQQESWKREREVAIQRCDTVLELEKENRGSMVTDTALLDRMTEKISQRIEEKLRIQLQGSQAVSESDRRDLVERMEAFLSSELTSYMCQICFELMAPPHRPPVLLFPCGHTFCKMCMERPGPSSTKCPYCRQCIKTKAENQQLKHLIEQFVSERARLENGEIHDLSQLFQPKGGTDGRRGGDGRRGRGEEEEEKQRRRLERKYSAEYRSRSMRHDILVNELQDSREHLQCVRERMAGAQGARHVLLEERRRIEQQMADLERQAKLVDEHLAAQREKEERVEREEREAVQKVTLLGQTVQALGGELEKCLTLLEGLKAQEEED